MSKRVTSMDLCRVFTYSSNIANGISIMTEGQELPKVTIYKAIFDKKYQEPDEKDHIFFHATGYVSDGNEQCEVDCFENSPEKLGRALAEKIEHIKKDNGKIDTEIVYQSEKEITYDDMCGKTVCAPLTDRQKSKIAPYLEKAMKNRAD